MQHALIGTPRRREQAGERSTCKNKDSTSVTRDALIATMRPRVGRAVGLNASVHAGCRDHRNRPRALTCRRTPSCVVDQRALVFRLLSSVDQCSSVCKSPVNIGSFVRLLLFPLQSNFFVFAKTEIASCGEVRGGESARGCGRGVLDGKLAALSGMPPQIFVAERRCALRVARAVGVFVPSRSPPSVPPYKRRI